MPPASAPAILQFISNVLTSKIIWAQVASLIAALATLGGFSWGTQADQLALVTGALVFSGIAVPIITGLARWWFPTGPLSISGPLAPPPNHDVPVGSSVVSIPAPKDALQAIAVHPLYVGTHTVDVAAPVPLAPIIALPSNVTVRPAATVTMPAQFGQPIPAAAMLTSGDSPLIIP